MAEESTTVSMQHHHHHHSLPRLMLPGVTGDQPFYSEFYDIREEKIHHQGLQDLSKKRCVGSSINGWLIMVEDESPSIFAVNPLTLARVHLPSLMSFPDIVEFDGKEYTYDMPFGVTTSKPEDIKNYYLKKVFLSEDPTEKGCMAIAIYGVLDRLAWCRVGDEEWKFMDSEDEEHEYVVDEEGRIISCPQDHLNGYEDVAFDGEGRFYALTYRGIVSSGDLKSLHMRVVYKPQTPIYSNRKYLVFDTKGQLLMINRYIGGLYNDDRDDDSDSDGETDESRFDFPFKTSKFTVFLVDHWRLEEMKRLGGDILFLGTNQSLCLSSSEFPGCRGDCIYFTDDCVAAQEPRIGGHDIGVFDLKDGCVDDIQFAEDKIQSVEEDGIWPPPIWVALPISH